MTADPTARAFGVDLHDVRDAWRPRQRFADADGVHAAVLPDTTPEVPS